MQDPTQEDDFRRFYEEHFPHIYNYVFYHTCRRSAAEDLTAETFQKAFQAYGGYSRVKGTERTWIYTIAKNVVRDRFKRKKWRSWLGLDQIEEPAAGEAGQEERLLREEELAELASALSGMEERERGLIALKFGFRLNNREIARETGLSESNVGTILNRALGRLRKTLLPEEES